MQINVWEFASIQRTAYSLVRFHDIIPGCLDIYCGQASRFQSTRRRRAVRASHQSRGATWTRPADRLHRK